MIHVRMTKVTSLLTRAELRSGVRLWTPVCTQWNIHDEGSNTKIKFIRIRRHKFI